MGNADPDRSGEAVERLVAVARRTSGGRGGIDEAVLRRYFAHVDEADLAVRAAEDLFGLAADHLHLASDWKRGSTELAVINPRVDVHGWENPHTVVMLVTDDMPFLVDSVTNELSRMNVGIHLVIHPILADGRDEGVGFVNPREHPELIHRDTSFISIEIDRQLDADAIATIGANLRNVLDDVAAAVDVVEVAVRTGVPAEIVAAAHFAVADLLELNWLRDHILTLPRDTQWASLARLTLRGDLSADHGDLTAQVAGGAARAIDASADDLVAQWMHRNAGAVDSFRRTVTDLRTAGRTNLTALFVAARELRNLLARTS